MAIKSYYATKFTWKETHIWVWGYKNAVIFEIDTIIIMLWFEKPDLNVQQNIFCIFCWHYQAVKSLWDALINVEKTCSVVLS